MNIIYQKQAMALVEASTSELFAIGFDDEDLFYTESPEEQGLTQNQPQEYLVRVFVTRTEVERYICEVATLYPEMKFNVRVFSNFEAMWPTLMGTNEAFLTTLKLPVRAVLCRMDPDTHPQEQGTVFSSQELPN